MEEVHKSLVKLTRRYFKEKKASGGEPKPRTYALLREREKEWMDTLQAEWLELDPKKDVEMVRRVSDDWAYYCDGQFHFFVWESHDEARAASICSCLDE